MPGIFDGVSDNIIQVIINYFITRPEVNTTLAGFLLWMPAFVCFDM